MGCEEDGEEGEEVWWGGEELGAEGCRAHGVEDCGEEDGHAAEGYVAAEEDGGCEVGFGVAEGGEDGGPGEGLFVARESC